MTRWHGVSMPDLPNRDKFERELTEELSSAIASARRQLVDALWREGMTQADIANAPPQILRQLENDLQRTLQTALAEAYISAAQNFAQEIEFGLDPDAVQEQGLAWATEYARVIARQLIVTREAKLREIAQRAPDVQLRKRDLIALLLLALGLAGIAAIAITELSNATSEGEAYTQRELENNGVTVEVLWYTREDERVCPICRPLHAGVMGEDWNIPPPAHPRCRCFLGYRITSPDGSVRVVFNEEEVVRLTST